MADLCLKGDQALPIVEFLNILAHLLQVQELAITLQLPDALSLWCETLIIRKSLFTVRCIVPFPVRKTICPRDGSQIG